MSRSSSRERVVLVVLLKSPIVCRHNLSSTRDWTRLVFLFFVTKDFLCSSSASCKVSLSFSMHMLLPSLIKCEPFRFTYTLSFLYKCVAVFSHFSYTLENCYSTHNIYHYRDLIKMWFPSWIFIWDWKSRSCLERDGFTTAFVFVSESSATRIHAKHNTSHRYPQHPASWVQVSQAPPKCAVLSLLARLPCVTILTGSLAKSRMAIIWTVSSAIRMT